jgi:hypothetical protein
MNEPKPSPVDIAGSGSKETGDLSAQTKMREEKVELRAYNR